MPVIRPIVAITVAAFSAAPAAAAAQRQAARPGGPRAPRGVAARVMSIRPRFPAGFGSPPSRVVHPAVVRPGLFAYSAPIREVVSPAADRLAGTDSAGDLYVRSAGSEEKRIVARAESPWRWDVEDARWSRDGRRLAVERIDDHEVPRIPIVDWTAAHESAHFVPYSRVGEPLPMEQVVIVDVASGRTIPVQHGFDDPYVRIVGWSADGRSVRLLRAGRLLKHVDLLAADAATGAVTPILRERTNTYIVGLDFLNGYDSQLDSLHLAWFLDTRGEFLWTSERSGFRHLYLYRADGQLVRPLTTSLPGLVHRIVGVDERRGWVYFTASTDTLHPYRQQLYRVSLAGGEPRELTDAGTISTVEFSPSMDSLAVLRMGVPDLFQVDVLGAGGAHAHTTWKADLGFLADSGVAPGIAWSLAADGRTRLRSMLFEPAHLDAGKRYPVVEFIYAGAHQRFVPDTLQDPWYWLMRRVASEGFVVVATDGRGTPGRGKAFQDFSYGRVGQVEIADHAAVLRELAHDRPYMDLSRVGVLGHSTGGYFALRALLLEPALYKVAHISAGLVDLPRFRVAIEPYMGCLPADCPDAYAKGANTPLVPQLQGRLSINQGTADHDVPFAESMRLVQTLERSGRNFELTVYPGARHTVMTAPQWAPRMLDFFQRYLMDGDSRTAAESQAKSSDAGAHGGARRAASVLSSGEPF